MIVPVVLQQSAAVANSLLNAPRKGCFARASAAGNTDDYGGFEGVSEVDLHALIPSWAYYQFRLLPGELHPNHPSLSMFETLKYLYYGLLVVGPLLLLVLGWGSALLGRRWTRNHTAATAVALVLLAAYVWASHIEPYMLKVRRVNIESAAVSRPLRIVHISDVQTPTIDDYERDVFAKIASLEPDLVVHTGDILQPPTEAELAKITDLLERLEPTYGVFNVEGDVDRQIDWQDFDRRADTTTLLDEAIAIDTEAGEVRLLGLTGSSSRVIERREVRDWLGDDAPEASLDVVLGHAPDFILNIRGEPVELALAGHTHGGQVRVPIYGPPLTLSHVPRDWALGHTVVDGTHLNVTSGVGAERAHGLPRIRFNCRPEITLILVNPG